MTPIPSITATATAPTALTNQVMKIDWKSMTKSSNGEQNNGYIILLDVIFTYLDMNTKWLIVERVRRTWLHASTVNACGWRLLVVTNELMCSTPMTTFVWQRLIGYGRASHYRHLIIKRDDS
jgi:hypothetical protein